MRAQHTQKTAPAKALSVELPSSTRSADRRLLTVAFCAALVIHLLALLISFPDAPRRPPGSRPNTPIVVKRYVPPPPKIQRSLRAVRTEHTRRIPIPDPTPDAPEPVPEPAPEQALSPIPGDIDVLVGEPAPPGPVWADGTPGAGPVLAGVGGATVPVRIEASYVKPEYPELARMARIEGNVVLQAVISSDGIVGETLVLRSSQPGYGFEEAAVAAVRQWRYEPARQDGHPVSVFFTILVEFSLV